jgi:hypothetical protein
VAGWGGENKVKLVSSSVCVTGVVLLLLLKVPLWGVTIIRGHVSPAPTSFLSLRMTPNEYPPLFNAKGGATLFLMCRLFITQTNFFSFFQDGK